MDKKNRKLKETEEKRKLNKYHILTTKRSGKLKFFSRYKAILQAQDKSMYISTYKYIFRLREIPSFCNNVLINLKCVLILTVKGNIVAINTIRRLILVEISSLLLT